MSDCEGMVVDAIVPQMFEQLGAEGVNGKAVKFNALVLRVLSVLALRSIRLRA